MKLSLSAIIKSKSAASAEPATPKLQPINAGPLLALQSKGSLNIPLVDVKDVDPSTADPDIKLLDYQIERIPILANALIRFRSALDASDTGTGKTYTSLGTVRQLKLPFGIICPKSVIPSWKRVCKIFGLEPLFILNYEALRGGNRQWLKWYQPAGTTHKFQKKLKWVFDNPDTLLIFDEAHRCKSQTSLHSKMMIAAKVDGIPTLALSATAATNPLEMKALGYVLGLHKLNNFYDWCRDHGCEAGTFGGLTFNKSEKVMLGIHKQIFPNRGVRVKIGDLGNRFPESLIIADVFDMGAGTSKINNVFEEMQNEIARLEERSANYSQQIFAILMEARQRAELLKVPTLLELIEDGVDEGMSVACFLNFNGTIAALQERLGNRADLIVGGQTEKERDAAITNFQTDKTRIILANIAAGGVGISLHDLRGEYPRLSLISPNFSAIQMVQALGRVWRQGSKTKSIQKIVFAAQTIEERACTAVRGKLRNLAALNDGDLQAGLKF